MPVLTAYKGIDVVEGASGAGGVALTEDFKELADRAPMKSDADPGDTNDETEGYFPGSLWFNEATETMWVCVDATEDAAVWKSFYRRTSTALELIPEETTEQVLVAGSLLVNGATDGVLVQISDDGAKKVTVTADGDVGVGTDQPAAKLHVQTGSAGTVTPHASASQLVVEHSAGGGLSILVPDSSDGSVTFGSPSDNQGARLQWNYNGNLFSIGSSKSGASTVLRSGDFVEALRGDADGNVGIGTTAPKARLHSTESTILGADSAAVGDSDLGNGQVNIWVDESNDKLMVKVKYSDGTVKSGEVALS